ncbi:MAG: chromosomal replication initiator protein DnaA [Neisseriaceae bacterium]|nr:chromosomal replication initiator protein DnaA [Neisseriaceae bacterium]MBQ9724326.1 chromosomal replication initiator protein DnaA [Neisseriaceae bacterium]
MMTLSDFLSQCTQYLQQELPPQFRMWVVSLSADEQDGQWNIYAPNDFTLRGVRTNIAPKIEQFKAEHCPDTPSLAFKEGKGVLPVFTPTVQKTATPESEKTPEKIVALTETPPVNNEEKSGSNGLIAEYTFDSFVVGDSNELAHAISIAISKKPGDKLHNPFFLYGGPGLGKTHLIHAIGNRLLANAPNAKIRYLHAERYMNDLVTASKNHNFDQFKKDYQSFDLLIMDDVQFIAGKAKTMEEFFYVFNHFINNGKQIILTSDRLPNEIEGLDDRLKSRFASGITMQIEMPDLETRTAILQKKAELWEFPLPMETAVLIADSIKSSVRDLEGALRKLMMSCRISGKQPDIITTQNTLKDLLAQGRRQVTIDEIQKTVATFYHISMKDLVSKNRQRSLVIPRHTAISLAKELTTLSLKDIGNAFDGRDHTTVLNACKNVKELLGKDETFVQDYQNLRQQLQN